MKNKHQGLACLIILCLSFAGMLGYGVYLADAIPGSIHVPGPTALTDIKVPDDDTLAYMNFLIPHLRDLGRPGKNNADADLRLFGFNPSLSLMKTNTERQTLLPDTGTLSQQEVTFSYALTLCFASLKHSFCVIDVKLYQTDGLLPDGGKILKIENDRVFIQKQNKKEWLYPLSKQTLSSEKKEGTI